jgi:hypothetical protein
MRSPDALNPVNNRKYCGLPKRHFEHVVLVGCEAKRLAFPIALDNAVDKLNGAARFMILSVSQLRPNKKWLPRSGADYRGLTSFRDRNGCTKNPRC